MSKQMNRENIRGALYFLYRELRETAGDCLQESKEPLDFQHGQFVAYNVAAEKVKEIVDRIDK